MYAYKEFILPPCLSINPYFSSEKSDSYHLPSIYLFIQSQYTWVATSELLTCPFMRNNFTQTTLQCLYSVHLVLSLILSNQKTIFQGQNPVLKHHNAFWNSHVYLYIVCFPR